MIRSTEGQQDESGQSRRYGTEFTAEFDRFRENDKTVFENEPRVGGVKTEVQSVLRENSKGNRGKEKQQQVDNADVEPESLDEALGDRYDEHGNLKDTSLFSKEAPDFDKMLRKVNFMEQKLNSKNLSEMSLEEIKAESAKLGNLIHSREGQAVFSRAEQRIHPEIDEEILQMSPEEREAKAAKILEEIRNMKF